MNGLGTLVALSALGGCLGWHPGLLTLHAVAAALVALGCIGLGSLRLRSGTRVPAGWQAGGLYACALVSLADLWSLWHADLWLTGGVKAIAAAVVVGTLFAQLAPKSDVRAGVAAHTDERAGTECSEAAAASITQTVGLQTRAILETIGHIVLVRDDDGAAVYASPHWERYTGAGTDSVLGQRWRTFVHPDDLETLDASVAKAQSCGRESRHYEVRVRGQDGDYRWFLARAAVLTQEPGERRQWLETFTDIEDLKRTQAALAHDIEESKTAEAMLARLRDAALAAADAKSRFLAAMSHEIRTPMNGIVGMAELLLLTRLDEEQRECSRVIRDSSRSLLRVLNDVLDYSKVEAGKLELEVVDFSVVSQVDSVVSLLRPQFDAKGVALRVCLDGAIPPAVAGDPGRLRQILFNLVGNALKFTPAQGRVTIRVDCAPGVEGVIPVWFTIEDTGIGIPDEVLERLFRPFVQADGSTTRRFGGTGLGLSICAQLISLMDGIIGVQSTPGTGSSFWFLIPLKPGSTKLPIPVPALQPVEERAAAQQPSRGERILVVEDNEVNALVARKQFAQLGFEVVEARDGQAAVDALAHEHFDLVFMDCHLPKLDGFEATAEIRAAEREGRRVPIVAMTADARSEDAQRCLTAGMDDYISKPATLAQLQAAVDRWLGTSASVAKLVQRRRVSGRRG